MNLYDSQYDLFNETDSKNMLKYLSHYLVEIIQYPVCLTFIHKIIESISSR